MAKNLGVIRYIFCVNKLKNGGKKILTILCYVVIIVVYNININTEGDMLIHNSLKEFETTLGRKKLELMYYLPQEIIPDIIGGNFISCKENIF